MPVIILTLVLFTLLLAICGLYRLITGKNIS